MPVATQKADLDNPQAIEQLVTAFYQRLLSDPQLSPIFLEVAAVDLSRHLPIICQYWQKLLLGDPSYQRHTMNIHRAIHAKQTLSQQDFQRWLSLFTTTVDRHFTGSKATRAKAIAGKIAANMHGSLN